MEAGNTQSWHFWSRPYQGPESRLYILLPFQEKYDHFLTYFSYFWLETGQDQRSKGQPILPIYELAHFCNTVPGYLPVKKSSVPELSSFAAICAKGHFCKIVIHLFKFGYFSQHHAQIFYITKLDLSMQNLILNRLTSKS